MGNQCCKNDLTDQGKTPMPPQNEETSWYSAISDSGVNQFGNTPITSTKTPMPPQSEETSWYSAISDSGVNQFGNTPITPTKTPVPPPVSPDHHMKKDGEEKANEETSWYSAIKKFVSPDHHMKKDGEEKANKESSWYSAIKKFVSPDHHMKKDGEEKANEEKTVNTPVPPPVFPVKGKRKDGEEKAKKVKRHPQSTSPFTTVGLQVSGRGFRKTNIIHGTDAYYEIYYKKDGEQFDMDPKYPPFEYMEFQSNTLFNTEEPEWLNYMLEFPSPPGWAYFRVMDSRKYAKDQVIGGAWASLNDITPQGQLQLYKYKYKYNKYKYRGKLDITCRKIPD